jgi:hypothetical protein
VWHLWPQHLLQGLLGRARSLGIRETRRLCKVVYPHPCSCQVVGWNPSPVSSSPSGQQGRAGRPEHPTVSVDLSGGSDQWLHVQKECEERGSIKKEQSGWEAEENDAAFPRPKENQQPLRSLPQPAPCHLPFLSES